MLLFLLFSNSLLEFMDSEVDSGTEFCRLETMNCRTEHSECDGKFSERCNLHVLVKVGMILWGEAFLLMPRSEPTLQKPPKDSSQTDLVQCPPPGDGLQLDYLYKRPPPK
jgi:hypothetical protein